MLGHRLIQIKQFFGLGLAAVAAEQNHFADLLVYVSDFSSALSPGFVCKKASSPLSVISHFDRK